MSYEKLVTAIATGTYDDKLNELLEVIQQRRKTAATKLAYTIKVGDRVVLGNIQPKSIVGQKATVTMVNRSTVTVVFDKDKDKSWAPPSRVPLQCCTLLAPES